jgi:hypothetical protein
MLIQQLWQGVLMTVEQQWELDTPLSPLLPRRAGFLSVGLFVYQLQQYCPTLEMPPRLMTVDRALLLPLLLVLGPFQRMSGGRLRRAPAAEKLGCLWFF